MSYESVVGYLSAFWLLIPIGLGLKVFKRERYLTLTGLFLVANLAFNLVILLLTHYQRNTYFLFHAYALVEPILLGSLYIELFPSPKSKQVIRKVIMLFVVYKVVDMAYITPLAHVDYVAISLEAVFLLVLAVLFFIRLFRKGMVRCITVHPAFWINNAVLFYFTGILIFSLGYFYDQEQDLLWSTFNLNYYLLLLRDTLIGVGLWFASRSSQSLSPASLLRHERDKAHLFP